MSYLQLKDVYYKSGEQYNQLYHARFNNESSVHFDFDIKGNTAFMVFNSQILNLVTEIMQASANIGKLQRALPNEAMAQYAIRLIVNEVQLTNEIEHVHSTRQEMKDALYLVNKGDSRFEGLLKKYQMLLGDTVRLSSCQDIRDIYDELVSAEVEAEDKANVPDGKIFRKESVSVYNEVQKPIHNGITPETKIIDLFEKGFRMLDMPINSFVKVALFHYLFGYIHPFYDGNGRVSRFISSSLIARGGLSSLVIGLSLSTSIKQNIKAYYKAFEDANDIKNMGELTPFVISFLEILRDSAQSVLADFSERKNKYVHYFSKLYVLESAYKIKGNALVAILTATLYDIVGLTKKELCETAHISGATADKYLASLKEENFLRIGRKGRQRAYEFDLDELDTIVTPN